MNGEILIFDKSKEAGESLAKEIRSAYRRLSGAVFTVLYPEEVFTNPLPENPIAAFFVLSGMYDSEAARKFHTICKSVPVVIVSENSGNAIMSYDWGVCDYLVRPFGKERLTEALKRCTVRKYLAG